MLDYNFDLKRMKPTNPRESRRRSSDDPRLPSDQSRRFLIAMDESFRAQWRSGPVSVLIYVLTLVVTYTLIARAIYSGDLSFGYVLLPWIVEYLLVAWVGVLLTRSWVKEPIFTAMSGRLGIALAWTIALLSPYMVVFWLQAPFGLDPDAGSLSRVWQRLVDSGMVWACLAVAVGLLLDTVRDVKAWRTSGGPFVWPATHRFGFKVAGLMAVWFATPFVIGFLVLVFWLLDAAGIIVETSDLASAEFQINWIVFSMLLAADLLVLVVGTWMHRRHSRAEKLAATSEADQ